MRLRRRRRQSRRTRPIGLARLPNPRIVRHHRSDISVLRHDDRPLRMARRPRRLAASRTGPPRSGGRRGRGDVPSRIAARIPIASAIAEVVRPMLKTGAVAVRSSAIAEDLGIASFAGQYRTFVRVDDLDDVFAAVRRCWASLWLPAARAYRERHHIDRADLAMGVVVQSMVEPDWSGVGFTKDPEGVADAMRIEVVPGLGEALVSGRITPDDFVVSKTTLEIRSRGEHSAPVFLEDLARMLLQVENRLDEPQDVEWAYGERRASPAPVAPHHRCRPDRRTRRRLRSTGPQCRYLHASRGGGDASRGDPTTALDDQRRHAGERLPRRRGIARRRPVRGSAQLRRPLPGSGRAQPERPPGRCRCNCREGHRPRWSNSSSAMC